MIKQWIQRVAPPYRIPLSISVSFHVLLILLLILGPLRPTTYRLETPSNAPQIMQAVAIMAPSVKQSIPTPQPKAVAQAQPKPQPREQPKPKPQVVVQPVKKVMPDVKAEQAQLAKLQAQRQAQEKARQLQKQKKINQQKKIIEQQNALQQQLLTQQLVSEQQDLAKQQQMQQTQGVVDEYKAKVLQAIQNQWIVPEDVDRTKSCILMISIGPGGVVLSATIIKTSGDPALDRSATAAVYKASPLPVPKDSAAFDAFRQLRLTVRPEEIEDSGIS